MEDLFQCDEFYCINSNFTFFPCKHTFNLLEDCLYVLRDSFPWSVVFLHTLQVGHYFCTWGMQCLLPIENLQIPKFRFPLLYCKPVWRLSCEPPHVSLMGLRGKETDARGMYSVMKSFGLTSRSSRKLAVYLINLWVGLNIRCFNAWGCVCLWSNSFLYGYNCNMK
jgi:hypothetical protein